MKKPLLTLLSTGLIVAMIIGVCPPPIATAKSESTNKTNASQPAVLDQKGQLEKSYTEMLQQWSSIPALPQMEIIVSPSADPANRDKVTAKSDSYGYSSDTVHLPKDSQVAVQVEAAQAGLYQIAFDYYVTDDSILPTEGYIQVNHEYPFFESRRILFPNVWEAQQKKQSYDRYGNELLPRTNKVKAWQHCYAMDSSYYYMTPLKYKLEKGVNTITFATTRGDLLLGNVTVDSPSDIDNYETYTKHQPTIIDSKLIQSPIVIEAETPKSKNDSSLRAISVKNPSMTPYDTRHQLLNAFGDFSWDVGGQSATWELDAPQDGYYKIAFKYMQDSLRDMPVFRKIEIDGKVPFRELEHSAFQYSKKWNNTTLGSNDKPYEIYLTKGKHAFTMTADLDPIRPLVEDIGQQMKEISRLTLEIRKLTGKRSDRFRDWAISEYIPNLDKTLNMWADQLEKEYTKLNQFNPDVDEIVALINLKRAASQLRLLAKAPDQLPNRMNLFSEGASSVSQMLGDLLQRITKSPLAFDKIYLYQQGELPKPDAGFWAKIWESIKRFFLSFRNASYSASNKPTSELNVWVNRSRLYVELMQKMIDEEFTPESGISIKLSIMPDQTKLVLANATGNQPDVALGVDSWIPYDLAIRNSAVDLRTFGDFDQVVKHFSKGAMIPLSLDEGMYALPETQDFYVLFYRKDILDNLKLKVPDTWDDVVNMLPELQRLGMNFFEPLAASKGFKPFSVTTPFVYQFGGELFTDDGMATAINSEPSLQGIKFMTDLFTIYNLPQDVPNFYQHFRSGTLPIGISTFDTYLRLKAAAPEIANSWKIAPHPGIMKDGVVQRWASTGGQTGMILKGTKYEQQSWDFLKWWLSTDVQVEFANLMQTSYGPSFMWNTANLEAFAQAPWPEDDKKVILEQSKWNREASRVPGAYMVERELSNVFNRVVFDGINPRTAIDDSVILSNREIAKKMEEFGYFKDGKIIKPYPVPTITTIDKWVEKR